MATFAELLQMFQDLPTWVHRTVGVAVVLLAAVIVNWVMDKWAGRVLERSRGLDATARGFLLRTMDMAIWALAVVVALAVAGVDTTALMGGLAVGGFIVGFALKDTLGNLAAGMMLLVYRPFSVGDTVTVDGQVGDITLLGMALTTMKAADGRIVTVPNGKVLGGTIINHTREPKRRADVLVGIGYDDDIDVATRAILDAVGQDPRVLTDPAPSVRITDLGDNAVGLQVRPWVGTTDYWAAQADLTGTVKRALESAGCSIPYPQRDLHIVSGEPTAKGAVPPSGAPPHSEE